MRELLAQYIHDDNWSGWMRYLFEKSERNPDGTVTIPLWAVNRWTRQMNTLYKDLSDEEKLSDLIEADAIMKIVERCRIQGL